MGNRDAALSLLARRVRAPAGANKISKAGRAGKSDSGYSRPDTNYSRSAVRRLIEYVHADFSPATFPVSRLPLFLFPCQAEASGPVIGFARN